MMILLELKLNFVFCRSPTNYIIHIDFFAKLSQLPLVMYILIHIFVFLYFAEAFFCKCQDNFLNIKIKIIHFSCNNPQRKRLSKNAIVYSVQDSSIGDLVTQSLTQWVSDSLLILAINDYNDYEYYSGYNDYKDYSDYRDSDLDLDLDRERQITDNLRNSNRDIGCYWFTIR